MSDVFSFTLMFEWIHGIFSASWEWFVVLWGDISTLWSRLLAFFFNMTISFLMLAFVFGYFFSLVFGGGGDSNQSCHYVKSNDVDFDGPPSD